MASVRTNLQTTANEATSIDDHQAQIETNTNNIQLNSTNTQEPNVNQDVVTVDNVSPVIVNQMKKAIIYCTTGGIVEIVDNGTGSFLCRKTLVAGDNLSDHINQHFEPDIGNDPARNITVQVPAGNPGVFEVFYQSWQPAPA